MNTKTIFLSITILITTFCFSQSTDFNHQIGISLKASTNGLGGDIYYRPSKILAIKAGGEYFNIKIKDKTLERFVGDAIDIKIQIPKGSNLIYDSDGRFKTGALTMALGYQPLKALYFTVGIGKYLFASEVTGTPISDLTFESHNIPNIGLISPKISKEDLGNFNITINPSNTIIPYFGIGLGSFVPQNKSFSFAVELGAYYVGSHVLKATMPPGFNIENIDYGASITQEQKDQFSENINKEINTVIADLNIKVNNVVNEINKTIKPYTFYPVLKLTMGFRVFEFRK